MLNFISNDQRKRLEKAYQEIKQVHSELDVEEHEEFFALNTTLELLDRAINYEKKVYG